MESDEAFPQNHAFQECQTCYNDTITGTNTCTTSSCANGCPGIPATQCKGGGNCCTCIGAVSSFGVLSSYLFFLVRRARELAFYAYSPSLTVHTLLLFTRNFQTNARNELKKKPGRKSSELPKIQLSVPAAAAFAAAESAASTAAGVAIWILKGRERREKESRTHRRVFLR